MYVQMCIVLGSNVYCIRFKCVLYYLLSAVCSDVLDSRPSSGYPVLLRRRDNSPEGSTVSDSTAVLMSAAPSGINPASSNPAAATEAEDPPPYSREDGYKMRTRKDNDGKSNSISQRKG